MQKTLFTSAIPVVFLHFFLVFLGVLLTEECSAQTDKRIEGYYLDLKKDTIKGFFSFDDLEQNRIAFYLNKTSEDYSTLRPNDVLSVETKNLSIIRFNYGYEKALFLVQCFSKDITLFKSYFNDEGEVFFIKTKQNSDIIKIKKDNPKAFFDTYFNVRKLDKTVPVDYTETSLLKAVSELDKCADSEKTYVHVSATARQVSRLSLSAGLKYSIFKLSENPTIEGAFAGNYNTLETTSNLGFLATLNYRSFSLKVGLNKNKFAKSFNNLDTLIIKVHTKQYGGANFYYKALFSFSYDAVEMPIELTYYMRFISKRITPMISVGTSNLTIQNVKLTQDVNPNYFKYDTAELLPFSWYSIPSPPSITDFDVPKSKRTFFFSAGLNLALTKNIAIELSGRLLNNSEAFFNDDGLTTVNTKRTEYAAAVLYTLRQKSK